MKRWRWRNENNGGEWLGESENDSGEWVRRKMLFQSFRVLSREKERVITLF